MPKLRSPSNRKSSKGSSIKNSLVINTARAIAAIAKHTSMYVACHPSVLVDAVPSDKAYNVRGKNILTDKTLCNQTYEFCGFYIPFVLQ